VLNVSRRIASTRNIETAERVRNRVLLKVFFVAILEDSMPSFATQTLEEWFLNS
jgi:hypothetical protein